MRQRLTRALDGLDPATRRAAQAAAAGVGMPLEEWLEQAVTDKAERSESRAAPLSLDPPDPRADELEEIAVKLKRLAQERTGAERHKIDHVLAASAASERRVRETVEKTALALDSVAAWIERAEDRFGETSRAASDSQERTAALVSETIGMVTRRLDDIERKLENGEHASVAEAVKAIERMEMKLSSASADDQAEHGAQIEAALKGFEERIAGLAERLSPAGPRPLGRRGVPAGTELRSAISDIRTRQFELDRGAAHGAAPRTSAETAPQGDMLRSLREDIAALSGRLDASRPADGEIAALRSEMTELQDALRAVARRDDVSALEDSIRALSSDVSAARSSGQGPEAVLAPLRSLEADVRRLAEEVAPETYGQLTRHIEQLADKLDLVAGSGINPAALEGLSNQLSDVRDMLVAVPAPDQVEALARQVLTLARETAELKARQIDAGDFASVKQAIEDIRTALSAAPPRGGRGAKLEDLKSTVAPIQSELERLSRRVEGFVETANPSVFDAVAAKLDRIEENFRRSGTGQDLRESLLQQLAEKLEKAERPGAGRDAMEALERQIEAIAGRLDRGLGGDPAIVSLERVMQDLMSQVGTLRDGTLEAAELAARNAVAGTLSALPQKIGGSANGDIGAIKRDMTDIKAYQGLADKRTQSSLDTLQSSLDKLLARLESGDDQALPALSFSSGSRSPVSARPQAESADGLQVGKRPAMEAAKSEPERSSPKLGDEILLEPGAARPGADIPSPSSPSGEGGADIRASFIAKARRAAQAAASEAASEVRERPLPSAALSASINSARGETRKAVSPAAFRAALNKHSRPILIALAAVVLALGSFQIYRNAQKGGGSAIAIHDGTKTSADPVAGAPPIERGDPRTTQSIVPPSSTLLAPSSQALSDTRSPSASAFVPPSSSEPSSNAAAAGSNAAKPPTDAESALNNAAKPAAPAGQSAGLGTTPPTTSSLPDRPVPAIAAADLPASITPAGLRQAALAGDAAALYELGLRSLEGRGVAKDVKLAARLLEKAASQGSGPAQYRTGSLYEKGTGVARDLEAARYWYQRAAELGNTRAMHNLAVMLAEGGSGRPDYPAALEWFKRAADYGVRDSQFNLGVLLARGLGTAQDLSRAYTWFAIAAMQGDEDAARKRDEVGSRMNAAEVTTAKLAADRWRARTAAQSANEVTMPAGGWSETPAKRPGRDGRV